MTQINSGTRDMMILTNNALVPPGESLPAWAAVGIVPCPTDVWSGGETTSGQSVIHQAQCHCKHETVVRVGCSSLLTDAIYKGL